MKTIRQVLLTGAVLFVSLNLHAQVLLSDQPDSIVQVTAEAEGLSQVDPTALPLFASCWWTVFPDSGPLPMPCPPQDLSVPIYEIADNIYLVDETGGAVNVGIPRTSGMRAMASSAVASAVERQGNAIADLIEQVQETEFEHSMARAFGMDAPAPGDGGGAGGGTNTLGSSYTIPNYGTNLWIAQTTITNSSLAGIGTNTIADVQYEIQSRTNLVQADWQSEGFIWGSELTNWTALSVPQVGRTNLFIRLRSWADNANVGIPDWWQLQYFGYVGIDPSASLAGDGFSNLYKYVNGLNPTIFIIPPAPANFLAVLSTNGSNVLLTWSAAQGSVTNYTIQRGVYDYDIGDFVFTTIAVVGAGTNAYVHNGAVQTPDDLGDVYEMTATYTNNQSSDMNFCDIENSGYIPPPPPAPVYDIFVSATLIRNSIGRWQLMFPALPASAQSINLIFADTNGVSTTQTISGSILTNGIYQIADTNALAHLGAGISVQGIGANGEAGHTALAGTLAYDAPCFVDGSEHLKQNLLFQLRAATVSQPNVLAYEYSAYVSDNYPRVNVPVDSNYVESSIFHWSNVENPSGCTDYLRMDDLWPFTVNYEFHQSLYDPSYSGATSFNWSKSVTTVPAPAVLGLSNPYWIQSTFAFYFDPCLEGVAVNPANGLPVNPVSVDTLAEVGTYTSGANLYLQSGVNNRFGLAFSTALINNGSPVITLNTGSSTAITNVNCFYSQTATPSLQFTNYYFAPVSTPGAAPSRNLGQVQAFPLPSLTNFASTNLTRTMIASVGQPIVIGGWEKFSIQNGAAGKYAYLGQYFVTNTFLIDNGGNVTTNSAGILSPYGEFFPTQAGKARLVTVPDSGRQGTCTVSVVSLNVDANHDGTMDLSYFGQDQTSLGKPYLFWCNNNFDRAHAVDSGDQEEDDLLSAGCPFTPRTTTPDYNYTDADGKRQISCIRDLEDYSRLWINGVTSNLLSSLPAGSTVTLNWGDVGSPNTSNPTIDLFQAADADGGIGYLTNNTVAAQQTNNDLYFFINRLAPGGSIQLNAIQFDNFWAGDHFIWCGVASGSGKLNLTFANAQGNVLGQASVYIQIKDIKQMYERWTIGENGSVPLTTAELVNDELVPIFKFSPPVTNTPYILHVHGWNMFPWEKDRFAETEYKRLYWQGYQGRFGEFRWPTFAAFPLGELSAQAFNPRNFDDSEHNAWLSGTGLLNKLTDLNADYPGKIYLTAHSMGNVVAGEALRLAGNNQVVNTYIAMQAAISAHTYDPNTVSRSFSPSTPDDYGSYGTSSTSYFNGSAGAATYVNFFNTNDFALHSATFSWDNNQNNKPDHGIAGFSIPYPGYYYSVTSQHPNGYFAILGAGSSAYQNFNLPDDTYTIFAYCDQSRSYALGAQANVGGVFKVGGVYQQIDLKQLPYNFDKEHKFHSGQFRSDNTQRWQFWQTTLVQMGLRNP
ncbi:MAG TPA: hypothetical protein VG347_02970 [Verrucomicrobiae bacterium]|nr:hypothetical protein [Verrucomicrobiae bacterium]